MTKINISIPQPCHENWGSMTPQDKGRFCASCQKKVFDFTKASDREIVTAFQQNKNLCGRFLSTQLDRDLVKPEKKNPIWLATTSAIITLVGLHEVAAQEKAPTEHTEKRVLLGKPAAPIKQGEVVANPEIEILGVVNDLQKLPLPGANVFVKGKNKIVQTDFDGKFVIKAKKDDIIVVSFEGFQTFEFKVNRSKTYNKIVLKELPPDKDTVTTYLGYVVKKPK